MIVEEYGICPNCGIETEGYLPKYCYDCGVSLEWKMHEEYFPPLPALPAEQNVMREGHIKCACGQEFYYETKRLVINCIKCGKEYSVV